MLASGLNIVSEKDFNHFLEIGNWFYNVCEVIEYIDANGKRLAEICLNSKPTFKTDKHAIEANAIMLNISNLITSFSDDLFFIKGDIKKGNNFKWELNIPFSKEQNMGQSFKLLHGLRNAIVHRHPINTRNLHFIGHDNNLGILLYPCDFDRNGDAIRLSPNIIEKTQTFNKLKYVNKERINPQKSLLTIQDWFYWNNGTMLCYLDCYLLGKDIANYIFDLFMCLVKRDDGNIKTYLSQLQLLGNNTLRCPKTNVVHRAGESWFHVVAPFLNKIQSSLGVNAWK